jgi:ribosomal protein L21E
MSSTFDGRKSEILIGERRMQSATVGDRVRIDIPEKDDFDYRYHGEHGEVIDVSRDDAGETTGDERDSLIYRIRLDSGEELDVRWRDIRPAFDG